jgi:tyrosyl-tRNA synthetase
MTIPEFIIGESEYKLAKLLVDSKICATNGEAKRLIQVELFSVNGNKITALMLLYSSRGECYQSRKTQLHKNKEDIITRM